MGALRSSKFLRITSSIIIRSAAIFCLLLTVLSVPCWAQAAEQADQCLEDSAWKNPDRAVESCTKAINTKVLTSYELVHSLNSRAWAYSRNGDYDLAVQDYDRAIQLKPDYAEAFYGRGLVYYAKKEFDSAIQDYSQAIQLKPGYTEAYNARGIAYLSLNQYDASVKAMSDFDEAVKLNPDFAEAFFDRGKAFASDGRFKRAIPDYTKAIELQPDYPEAFVHRSDAYMYIHDSLHALEDLNQAIKLNPEDADAIFARSSVYVEEGDNERAIRDVTEVIHLKPNELWPYWFRALDYYGLGQYDEAIQDLNRVVEAQPEINVKTVNYVHQRGLAYLYKGDYSRAIADFEVVGTIFPWDFYREGLAYFYMGDFETAEKSFDRGGQFIYSDVWAYLAAERAGEKAADKLARINRESPLTDWPGPVVHFYLGSVSAAQLLKAAQRDDLEDKNPCMCDDSKPSAARNKYHTLQSESAAYFYIGEHELLSGHLIAAKALFQKSIATGTRNTDEYQGALAELRRMKVSEPSRPAAK